MSSPWAFTRPGPGPRPPRPSGSRKPSLRDSQRLLTTQHPGLEPGLGRRSCHSHHPVTGFRSVTTAAAALFLRLFGDPPTSLTTNEERGRQETTVRRPAQALPRRKAKLLSEICVEVEGRDEISKLPKARGTSGHFGVVALRRASRPGLLGPAAMLKCGMNGSQVKGGAAFPPFL